MTGLSPGTTDTESAVSQLRCPVVGNYKALAFAVRSSCTKSPGKRSCNEV